MADNVLGNLFSDIADAIRAKTGEDGTMKPLEFPEKIAGIEAGGSDAGGDSKLAFAKGSFTATGATMTVSHNMGVVPDIIVVYPSHVPTTGNLIFSSGFSSALLAAVGGGYIVPTQGISVNGAAMSYSNNTGMEYEGPMPEFSYVRNVTNTTFVVGGDVYSLYSNKKYAWFAISGII